MGLTFLLLQGCSSPPTRVIAVTGTNIGVEISQNPATQTPHAKLGYQRSEVALVPTNRREEDPATGDITGAEETTEVLMELKYAGIFSWGDSGGIYQRLAVGDKAVLVPGAAVMFARNVTGDVDKEAAKAVAKSTSDSANAFMTLERSADFVSDEQIDKRAEIATMIENLAGTKTQDIAKNLNLSSDTQLKSLLATGFGDLDSNTDGTITQTELNNIDAATSKKYLKFVNTMATVENVRDALKGALIAAQ